MDLVFKRYASPYLILDQMILFGSFSDFVSELWNNYNDELTYQLYLSNNPYNTVGFADFKKSLITPVETKSVETTLQNSYALLNNFKPQGE